MHIYKPVIPGLTGDLPDQVQELIAGPLILEKDTAEGRCGCHRIGLLHTPERHASV